MSKIQTISELSKLSLILKDHFGEVPDNLIVVSPEIMREIKAHHRMPLEQPLSDIKILEVNVMSDVAEVIQ